MVMVVFSLTKRPKFICQKQHQMVEFLGIEKIQKITLAKE